MRPASPAGYGRIGERLVFLLPGNPVSCLCAYDFFACPAIRQLGGLAFASPYRTARGVLTQKISSAVGRLDYVRVKMDQDEVTPLVVRGASLLSSTTRADGFVLVSKDSEGQGEGSEVVVHLYDTTG